MTISSARAIKARCGIPNRVPLTNPLRGFVSKGTVCPLLTKTANPQRTQLIPKVVIKEGILSLVFNTPLTAPARPPKIGRASCRERGVDLGGGRVSKKKKVYQ